MWKEDTNSKNIDLYITMRKRKKSSNEIYISQFYNRRDQNYFNSHSCIQIFFEYTR